MRGTHLLILVVAAGSASCRSSHQTALRHPAAAAPSAESHRIRDLDISFYESRVSRDPYGARDRAILGALYLQRARSSGSEGDIRRAESLARASITTRHKRNGSALSTLRSRRKTKRRAPRRPRTANEQLGNARRATCTSPT